MPSAILDICLPAERLAAVYRGQANRILVYSRDGRSFNLPAHHLRPFVGREGVKGVFELEFSSQGQLLALRRLG